MSTKDGELIRTARAVARLQRQIATHRRAIKKAQAELRYERRLLRALAYAAENGVQSMPSRLTGGATGYKLPAKAKHLASCQQINEVWFCAADCPHHVIVDVDAEKVGA
jgi:hypothetical protein